MKKLLIYTIAFIGFVNAKAQQNPYELFGYAPTNEYVMTKKKLEIKNTDTSQISFVLYFDFASKKVCLKDKFGTLLMAKDIPTDVLAKWTSVDPKASQRAGVTPYNFVQNNPMLRIDPDGQLDFNPTEQQLKDNDLTKDDITRFKSVIDNISNIVKDNPTALDVLVKNTGFRQDQILSDLKANTGTKVNIGANVWGMSGSSSEILVDPAIIKAYAALDPNNLDVLSKQTLGLAMSIIHEYTHTADQICNNGLNSGEWSMSPKKAGGIPELNWGGKTNPKEETTEGFQQYKTSFTQDRGFATTVFGYGQNAGIMVNTFYSDQANTNQYDFTNNPFKSTFPKIPTSLPVNMRGTTILQTLRVK